MSGFFVKIEDVKLILPTILAFLIFSSPFSQAKKLNDTIIKVNREYGGIHMVAVPQEFSIHYPDSETYVVYPEKLTNKGPYFELQFADTNNKLKENLILSYKRFEMADEPTRLNRARSFLLTELAKYPQAGLISTTNVQIGNTKGTVLNAQSGAFYFSLIMILNPKSHHCLKAIITIDPKYSKINSISDLEKLNSIAFRTLNTLRFGRELM